MIWAFVCMLVLCVIVVLFMLAEADIQRGIAERAQTRAENRALQIQRLTEELRLSREETRHWKHNHDNQVHIKRLLQDRPDLKERAKLVQELMQENEVLRMLLEKAEEGA